ncbi:MAG TPA: YjgN family protein [Pedomonas sp.]|uniref:YjgN family protein n=1 Tax=Pedomonas sp. TaxID=2976421 RepID=UPI002F3E9A08
MDHTIHEAASGQPVSIEFEGNWREYFGIALVNLLLTIVTLGIYRFWAKTRSRQYLWSRTIVMGEALEYTGTGLQLFLGALIAFFAVLLPFTILMSVAQAMAMSGQVMIAGLIYLAAMPAMIYLLGVGLYRSQRYLLAQTSWRGIRGGMTTGGWAYGLGFLGRGLAVIFTLFLAGPWAATRDWNQRWQDARFGSLEFTSDAPAGPLFKRYLLMLAGIAVVYGLFLAVLFANAGGMAGAAGNPEQAALAMLNMAWLFVVLFVALWLVTLSYRAYFWRHIVGHMRLDTLSLRFTATTGDWARFMLGNAALVALTLGLGLIMLPYRVYGFMMRHMEAEGALSPQAIAQSQLAQPGQGEGIADAFDLVPV